MCGYAWYLEMAKLCHRVKQVTVTPVLATALAHFYDHWRFGDIASVVLVVTFSSCA